MIETFTVTLGNGIELSCRGAGSTGDPVLVFLHGFPEAAFVWDDSSSTSRRAIAASRRTCAATSARRRRPTSRRIAPSISSATSRR
jgi:pimeloyl-ACP methyl ester carboxylesterase